MKPKALSALVVAALCTACTHEVATTARPASQPDCAALVRVALPDTVIGAARPVDAGEVIDRLVVRRDAQRVEGQQRRRLRQRLEHQHPRHHRAMGEVAGEERLVDGHVLQRDAPLARVLDDAVDEQERVAVGQHALDGDDIQRQRRRARGRGDRIVAHRYFGPP